MVVLGVRVALRQSAVATGGLVQHGATTQWFMMVPAVVPIVMSLPSLCRHQCCDTELTRGHRSVLAQNSLLMYPPFFFLFGLVVDLLCPRHVVDWYPCVCAAVAAFLLGVVRSRFLMDMWVAEGHTARWPWLCVLFAHRPRCGCRPASGMSTPSRCRALLHCRGQ